MSLLPDAPESISEIKDEGRTYVACKLQLTDLTVTCIDIESHFHSSNSAILRMRSVMDLKIDTMRLGMVCCIVMI